MSNSPSESLSKIWPPLTFKEFEDLVKNTERFYVLGCRLSEAIEKESCEYLIQEASMAFTKDLMSLGVLKVSRVPRRVPSNLARLAQA